MKIIRLKTGWSGTYFEDMDDVIEVTPEEYDAFLNSDQAEPLCTLNSTVAAASLAEAAVRLGVELTTDDQELANYMKTYGATVHVKRVKK